ncbi:hypothetical protein [Mycobacterium szulgai]|uniref:PE domain-containing protein n=1 Tax=Mycobacterium szulgai TaxID=1787 RepID=A0A1X2F5J0_MYCSZ|nr:hypothetical protein [Mycobacterium szulgai]MCV7077951.1 hypothetical protein [Mycobacterium szulgai]ORX13701.1 hypothetical protein AWC27_21030 [Mycobacterium szulgai]
MLLRVGADDLRAMAGRWEAVAGELTVSAACDVGLPCQASAAAVTAGNADIAAAAGALSARLRTGATRVAAANTGFVGNERGSVGTLDHVKQV